MDAQHQKTLAALENVIEWLDRAGESKSHSGKEYNYVTIAREAIERAKAWQAAERTAKKQHTAQWQAFLFVVAVLVASILGLFGLPLLLIYFTGGGC